MQRKEASKNAKVKVDIDFCALGSSYEAKLIFNTIIQYNGGGKSKVTASKFVLNAFNKYDDSIDFEALAMINAVNKSQYIAERYHISSKEDIISFLKNNPLPERPKLIEPYKRIIVINFEHDGAKAMYKTLTQQKPKQRPFTVYDRVLQYLVLSKNEFYYRNAAINLINSVNLLRASEGASAKESYENLLTGLLAHPHKEIASRKAANQNRRGVATYSYPKNAEPGKTAVDELNRLFGYNNK